MYVIFIKSSDTHPGIDHHFSNAQLANMLFITHRDAHALQRDLALELKRADHSDRILTILNVAATPMVPHPTFPKTRTCATCKVVRKYGKRITEAGCARDKAETRRHEALEAWRQLDDFLNSALVTPKSHTPLRRGPRWISLYSVPPAPFFSPSTTHTF